VAVGLAGAGERVRLWVDGALLVDQWASLAATRAAAGVVFAAADAPYFMELEYHAGGDADASAAPPGLTLELGGSAVPAEALAGAEALAAAAIDVDAARPDPGASRVRHATAAPAGLATAGVPLALSVALRDRFGNVASGTGAGAGACGAQGAGFGSGLVVTMREGDTTRSIAVEAQGAVCSAVDGACVDDAESASGVATPVAAGAALVEARIDGQHVAGSPLALTVAAGAVSGAQTVIGALSLVTAGTRAVFHITARDEHRNLALHHGAGAVLARLECLRDASADLRAAGERDGCASGAIEAAPLDGSRWELPLLLTVAGNYRLAVLYQGVAVRGSPIDVRAAPAPTCAAASAVRGAGLTLTSTGTATSFVVVSRDAFGNYRSPEEGAAAYVARLRFGAGRPRLLAVAAAPTARTTVGYAVTEATSASMEVTLAVAGGLAATYYGNVARAPGDAIESAAAGAGLDWSVQSGEAAPVWDGATTQYAARWAGAVDVAVGGGAVYTFSAALKGASERVRVWVDQVLLIDAWASLPGTLLGGTLAFPGGAGAYDIALDYSDKQSFESSFRGLTLRWQTAGGAGGAGAAPLAAVPRSALRAVESLSPPLPHVNRIGRVCAARTTFAGASLTLLSAGVAAAFTITARDAYGNLVPGPLAWLHGPTAGDAPQTLATDEQRGGAFAATAAGAYQHQVQIVQSGSLAATFYADAGLGAPALTGDNAAALGDLSDPALQAAIAARPEYFSVRWAGYLRPARGAVFTFLADPAAAQRLLVPPPPPSCTKWTRLFHPSVLTGHVSVVFRSAGRRCSTTCRAAPRCRTAWCRSTRPRGERGCPSRSSCGTRAGDCRRSICACSRSPRCRWRCCARSRLGARLSPRRSQAGARARRRPRRAAPG